MTRAFEIDEIDLTGKILIAMPGMGDARFEKSVIFVCAHSPEGAMGLIVNKPVKELGFKDLVSQLEIGIGTCACDCGVHFGGPVEPGRGFVLHSKDYSSDLSTLTVGEEFCMTATTDVLEKLAAGAGPEHAIMALGYAGWGPGQIEQEILANGWLTCDASLSLVFEEADTAKWEAALKILGVDALNLSSAAGRA